MVRYKADDNKLRQSTGISSNKNLFTEEKILKIKEQKIKTDT